MIHNSPPLLRRSMLFMSGLVLLVLAGGLLAFWMHSSKAQPTQETAHPPLTLYALQSLSLSRIEAANSKNVWQQTQPSGMGGGWEEFVFDQQRIYLLSSFTGSTNTSVLEAYHLRDGSRAWSIPPHQATAMLSPGQVPGLKYTANLGFFSSPTLAHNMLYVSASNGYVYAFDTLTGKQRWASQELQRAEQVCQETLSNGTCYGTNYPVRILGNVAYALIGSTLFALDATNGSLKWSRHLNIQRLVSEENAFFAQNDVLYLEVRDPRKASSQIQALSARDGKQLWTSPSLSSEDTWHVVYGNHTVYFLSDTDSQATTPSARSEIYALDTTSGLLRWKQVLAGRLSTPVIDADDTLYLINEPSNKTTALVAWKADSTPLWRISIPSSNNDPIFADGPRLIGIQQQQLYVLVPSQKNRTGAGSDVSLFVYQAKEGKERYRYQLPTDFQLNEYTQVGLFPSP